MSRSRSNRLLARRSSRRGWTAALALAVLVAGSAAGSAQAAEWRVPSPGAPTPAAALAKARDGDRIRIAPGIYRERLVVTKRIALIGEGGEGGGEPPTIDGQGQGRVIELRAPGAEVRGLRVRGSGDDLDSPDACLYVAGEARGARIYGNILEDCISGIWVKGAAAVEIVANRISGRPKRFVSEMGNGINLWQISAGTIRANAIERVRDGIFLAVATDSRVEYNRMRDLRFGIHYMYSDRNGITGNVACDSQLGLAIMESRGLTIRGNAALRNREQGLLLRTIYDSTITGNRAEGNGTGLVVNDAAFNRIEGNWVSGNAIGVHVTGGYEQNRVTGNAFLRNAAQVTFGMAQPAYWDDGARGNYWSGYLGWDLDRDGIGDRAYHASGTMDGLVFRYPELKVLAASPVLLMLQWVEAKFPVVRPPSIIDRHPLMESDALAAREGEEQVRRAFQLAAAGTPAAAAEFCGTGASAPAPRGENR